jgi:hypothetical protein
MKTGYFVIVVMLAVCLSAVGQTSTAPAVGDGSSGSPYQIATLENLYWISQNSSEWGKYFIQTADIDASTTSGWSGGAGFPPIGDISPSFTGHYDGNGKIISGLYINNSSVQNIGLFGYVYSASATITSLGLTGINVSSSLGPLCRLGGLAGYVYGSVSNCYSTGTISRSGSALIGGLVGFNDGGTFNQCYSKVNVSAGATYVGGFAGSSNGGSFTDCYATGSVVGGSSTDVGGFMGLSSATVTNCYSSGSVTGSGNVGGLIGADNSGTVNNSFWDTQTSGQSSSPGGGTGKNTSDMKTQSTFTGASWNFTTIWEMIGTNYPRLKSIPDAALPVEFSSITAIASANTVALQWQTATEVNNYGFEIERGSLGMKQSAVEWQKVGFVEGRGTSSSPHNYTFIDASVASGRYAYRIKQINADGSYKYTHEVEVDLASAPRAFALNQNYPNPFNPTTNIEFTVPEDGRVKLKVYNMLGEEVATLLDGTMTAGKYHRVSFDASHFAGGVYFARLQSGGKQLMKKMLLLK